jgi:hypothetical protein
MSVQIIRRITSPEVVAATLTTDHRLINICFFKLADYCLLSISSPVAISQQHPEFFLNKNNIKNF